MEIAKIEPNIIISYDTIEQLQKEFREELIDELCKKVYLQARENISSNRYNDSVITDLTQFDIDEYFPNIIDTLTDFVNTRILDFSKYYEIYYRSFVYSDQNEFFIIKKGDIKI